MNVYPCLFLKLFTKVYCGARSMYLREIDHFSNYFSYVLEHFKLDTMKAIDCRLQLIDNN